MSSKHDTVESEELLDRAVPTSWSSNPGRCQGATHTACDRAAGELIHLSAIRRGGEAFALRTDGAIYVCGEEGKTA